MKRSPASRYTLTISKGADFEKVFTYFPEGADQDPKDWTGYAGKAQLRKSHDAESPLLEFSVALGADGSVKLEAAQEATKELAPGTCVWDLYITGPEGKIDRFMAGTATITQQVTHE